MIEDETRLVRSGEPLTAEVDGDTAMFDPTQGKYFALGGVGGRIWELLEEPRSLAELCDIIVSEFEVDAAGCRADVVPFLDELRAAGLVEVRA